jgi:hypothetical protein
MGRLDSPLRDRVIFVEGAPRSGTTWLVTLLATHPEIAGVEAESHLFDFGVDRLFDNIEGRDPLLRGLQSYLDRDQLVDLARDLCDGALLAMRAHVSTDPLPPFVVEKTPISPGAGGLDLERKRDCYPDAWYLHIVRDRDAVARSLMRAPWQADRSYAACAALWDRTVGAARSVLGGLPRYREVSYEALRADPAAVCGELFAGIGVAEGDEALETVRALSRERFSDLGAVPAAPPRLTAAALGRLPRRALAGGRAALGRSRSRASEAGDDFGQTFVRSLRERDLETLRSLTAPSFEFVYRGPGGDRLLRDDDGRDALAKLAEDTFTRRHVAEWWASPGEGAGEWWTAAPGKPFAAIFLSALGGNGTRVDLAFGIEREDGLIRRALIVSAGSLAGRPVVPSTG